MNTHFKRAVGALSLMTAVVCTAPALAANTTPWTNSVVAQWNQMALQAVLDTHPGPPMTARELAIVNTCMYDAWAAYDPVAVGTSAGGPLRRPAAERTVANKSMAISYAAYRACLDLFPQAAEAPKFQALMTSLGFDPNNASTDTSTPAGIGNVATQNVVAFRHHDGSNQLGDLGPSGVPYSDYTGYVAVNAPGLPPSQLVDPNRWQPLIVPDGKGGLVTQKYAGPHWGLVVPFAMTSGDQFRSPNPPAKYGSVEYEQQARDLLTYSANLTDKQKVIIEHWADGPGTELPPGHWQRLAGWVAARDNMGLDDEMKLSFLVANATFDAGIACWDTKRFYDYVRPYTAIHFLFQGQPVMCWGGAGKGTVAMDGSLWTPYQLPTVLTPAFPEFPSGHSAFSAAAAEVMKRFTGSDAFGASFTAKAGSSIVELGVVPATDMTLSWSTFTEAADEAAMSRIFGGIHFMAANYTARIMGRQVGSTVWEKAQSYFNGTAIPAH